MEAIRLRFISKWTTLIVSNTTHKIFAGQGRSSTTFNYIVALSLQAEFKEETLYRKKNMPLEVKYTKS
jgi:hypothetical protein